MESIPLSNQVAAEAKMDLKEGVYIQLAGPTFETPGEIFISGERWSFTQVSINLMCRIGRGYLWISVNLFFFS